MTTETVENPNKFKLVQQYLVNEDHIVSRQLIKFEAMVNVSKEILVNIFVSFVALILLLAEPPAQQWVTSVVSVPFPVYCTYSSFTIDSVDEFKIWLLYWSFYVSFEFLDPYFATLPFYWLAKLFFLLSLSLPPINLSKQWYLEWVKPLSCIRQKAADREVMSKAHPKLLSELELDTEKVRTMDENELKKKLADVDGMNFIRQLLHMRPLEAI